MVTKWQAMKTSFCEYPRLLFWAEFQSPPLPRNPGKSSFLGFKSSFCVFRSGFTVAFLHQEFAFLTSFHVRKSKCGLKLNPDLIRKLKKLDFKPKKLDLPGFLGSEGDWNSAQNKSLLHIIEWVLRDFLWWKFSSNNIISLSVLAKFFKKGCHF